jgi:hypothetical protein
MYLSVRGLKLRKTVPSRPTGSSMPTSGLPRRGSPRTSRTARTDQTAMGGLAAPMTAKGRLRPPTAFPAVRKRKSTT